MFTIALYNKALGPSAAVYVQDTKSWKFVKSFNEEPVCEKLSELGLNVASSIPNLNVSPEELFELLGNIEKGIALFCDSIVANNPEARNYASAVPDAVAKMFQGYDPNTHAWAFQPNSPVPDGMFEEINVQRANYQFSCEEFVRLVTSYINTFPITSTGNVGTVYVMATC